MRGLKPTLLVLAAGMGSRYGGLKQVDPVGPGGEILLEYSAFDAVRAGFGKLVFVIRRDIEKAFRDSIGSRLQGKLPLDYAFQELDDLPSGYQLPAERSKPWGTGHAIWCARSVVDGPFVAINADDFYGPQSFRTIAAELTQSADRSEHDYSMVGFRLNNTLSEHGSVSRGVCNVDEQSHLISVREHTRIESTSEGPRSIFGDGSSQLFSGEELVSMNFWGLRPSIFPELERQFRQFLDERSHDPKAELYIPFVLDQVIREKRGSVKVLSSSESWFGVTYPQDKARVVAEIAKKIEQGLYPERLWS